MRNRLSFRVAFCGVLAALMIAVMLLGTMIPILTSVRLWQGSFCSRLSGNLAFAPALCSTWPWLC